MTWSFWKASINILPYVLVKAIAEQILNLLSVFLRSKYFFMIPMAVSYSVPILQFTMNSLGSFGEGLS